MTEKAGRADVEEEEGAEKDSRRPTGRWHAQKSAQQQGGGDNRGLEVCGFEVPHPTHNTCTRTAHSAPQQHNDARALTTIVYSWTGPEAKFGTRRTCTWGAHGMVAVL